MEGRKWRPTRDTDLVAVLQHNRALFMFHILVASMKHKKYPTEWPEVKYTLKNPYTHTKVKDVYGSKWKGVIIWML